jgi:hypothetical protein
MNFVMRHGKRIEVETFETRQPKRKRKPFTAWQWVKVPRGWVTTLARSKSTSTYQLAFIILVEALKRKYSKYDKPEINLSTKVTGMPRCTKMRAARELADLGLIRLDDKGSKKQVLKATIITY